MCQLNSHSRNSLIALLWCLIMLSSIAGAQNNFCEIMMRSTFQISDGQSAGTVFIMGRPDPVATQTAYYVMITADHVLSCFRGDTATLALRTLENGEYKQLPHKVKIRDAGKPLWVKHPSTDVAAMYVSLPRNCDLRLISTDLLATDDFYNEFEIQPGDEVFVFGFPLGLPANPAGFPILRSARIANFPLTPVASTVTFLVDFEIFPGNSGGPVLLNSQNRFYKGGTHIGITRSLLGIVSQEMAPSQTINTLDETITKKYKVKVAIAVHAYFVKEILKLLPFPKLTEG